MIPSWDGSARTWRRYTREVAWFFRATPSHKRRYVATKLLSRLTGSARLLAMSWTDMALDDYDGTRTLLRRLSASPLVRQSLPNASAICSQYFDFKRRPGEPMTAFLVRESLGYAEFVESLVRLAEEKKGSSSETSDFGLPPKPHDDAGWEYDEWSHDDGGLGWFWQHDQDDVGVQTSPASAAAGPAGDSGSPAYQRVPRDSPPSRRSAGVQPSFFAEDKTEINELTFADSFVLGVLRGFRLLQAAGLTPDERRVILSSTRGSLEFEEITKALQNEMNMKISFGKMPTMLRTGHTMTRHGTGQKLMLQSKFLKNHRIILKMMRPFERLSRQKRWPKAWQLRPSVLGVRHSVPPQP